MSSKAGRDWHKTKSNNCWTSALTCGDFDVLKLKTESLLSVQYEVQSRIPIFREDCDTVYPRIYILLTVSKIYLMENKGAETELTVKPEVDLVACNEPHSGQLSLHWRQCGGERRELWGLWLNKETDTESDQKINPRGDESKVLIARDPFSLRVTGGNKMFPLLEEEVRRRWGGGEEEEYFCSPSRVSASDGSFLETINNQGGAHIDRLHSQPS